MSVFPQLSRVESKDNQRKDRVDLRSAFYFASIESMSDRCGLLVSKGDESMTDQPQEMPGKDRRNYPRAKIAVAIEFKPEGAAVASHAQTADLSLSGCYVEMSFTLPVGRKLDIVLWVEDERLATTAIVVTHHPQFGNGIEFRNMSAEGQTKLAYFLKMRSEEKPEANASG
jgi:hypothetical protein